MPFLKLKGPLIINIELINEGLYKDLGKSPSEAYMCETGLVLSEITYMLKHIKKFSKPRRVRTPLAQYISKSFELASPYGVVLVMSPWNYPFLLSLDPIVEAVAAGNVVLLKTSEYSPNTNKVVKRIIENVFPKEYVSCVFGGYEENSLLLQKKFDYIFFTGSKKVGNIVYQSASKSNTPVSYGKIINLNHFRRINNLIDKSKVIYGGNIDESRLKIGPTIMDYVSFDDKVMKEEIFGPIFPIIESESLDEVIGKINEGDTPLACYIYSSNKRNINKLVTEAEFGGGCINDCIIHLASSYLRFGGFKESGIGSYHGFNGFQTFSHYKSIVDKKTIIDLPMRYQPYKKLNDKLVRFFLK